MQDIDIPIHKSVLYNHEDYRYWNIQHYNNDDARPHQTNETLNHDVPLAQALIIPSPFSVRQNHPKTFRFSYPTPPPPKIISQFLTSKLTESACLSVACMPRPFLPVDLISVFRLTPGVDGTSVTGVFAADDDDAVLSSPEGSVVIRACRRALVPLPFL